MFRQKVKNLVHICVQHGVRSAVIAPGSRNTPLTIAFTEHPAVSCYSITDERSAAFFALGMAQYADEPVVVVCTSGTAVLNFAPAIAEAYYQNIPLIVLTADRPAAWIDQADGQTIRQDHIFKNFIKESFILPTDHGDGRTWYSDRLVASAIDLSKQFPRGPVHLNIPLDEPLYVELPEKHGNPRIIRTVATDIRLSIEAEELFKKSWNRFPRKMIVVGIGKPDRALNALVEEIAMRRDTLVVAENLSNISGENIISCPDLFFASLSEAERVMIRPDLLITIGHSSISKQMKTFLRDNPPEEQWQVDSSLPYADTYQSLNYIVPVKATTFLKLVPKEDGGSDYGFPGGDILMKMDAKRKLYMEELLFSDLYVMNRLLPVIPVGAVVHISNSTPIRLSQMFPTRQGVEFYCNRGTSGIDGSVSTAAGSACVSGKPTWLITGDLSFLYDSNGLWNKYLGPDFRIVLLNNGGANIFRMIGDQSVLENCRNFFDAGQDVGISALSEAYGIEYKRCEGESDLDLSLEWLNGKHKQASVLEIKTDMHVNTEVYKKLFKYIKK